MWGVAILTAVAAVLLAYYLLKPKAAKGYEWAANIPALTLTQGLRLAFSKDTHLLLAEFANHHGPIFQIKNPDGGVRMLVVTDPPAAKIAMKSEVKGSFYDPFKRFHAPVLFLGEGDWWRKQRRITSPVFSGSSVRALHGIMVEETQNLFNALDAKPKGTPFDADDLFCRLTLDVIGRTIYGESFDALSGREVAVQAALAEGLLEIQKRISNPLRNYYTKGTQRLVENMHIVHSYGWKAIEKRRATENWEEINDLLTILLTSVDSETGEKMPDEQIARELGAFIAAGHETSAHTLAWTLYHMLQNPDVTERCRTEVDEVMEGRSFPTHEDLKKMKQLDLIMKESMRLTPVSPMGSARDLNADAEICGFAVPKGTSVWVPFYPLFTDAKLWEDPMAFKPERFLDISSSDPKYMPFSAGPRNCLGKAMAELELQIVLAGLLRNYTFRLTPDAKVEGALEITLKPRGLMVLFERRPATVSDA